MAVQVRSLESEEHSAWDDFVCNHPHGTPFHLLAWKRTIQTVFGFAPQYLAAFDGSTVVGVLPLFEVRNPVVGRVLISSPFAVYGGILASSDESRSMLAQAAAEIAHSLQVQHLELRNAFPDQKVGIGFLPLKRYVTFTKQVETVNGETLLQKLPKKTRNLVRKALKHPFSVRITRDYRNFERLYSKNLRRLGTPSFPPRLFSTLIQNFGRHVDVREILLDDRIVAASFNFIFRGEMHTYYAAADYDFIRFAPNMFLYYDHLLWAGHNGLQTFDFGRSKQNTGTVDFKLQWDPVMRELPYEILLVKRKELPNFSPVNPKFSLPIAIWQKLPLPLTRALGPHLVKFFP
jgi:FemAB-related protein (PEP-CTERM system-associated)